MADSDYELFRLGKNLDVALLIITLNGEATLKSYPHGLSNPITAMVASFDSGGSLRGANLQLTPTHVSVRPTNGAATVLHVLVFARGHTQPIASGSVS